MVSTIQVLYTTERGCAQLGYNGDLEATDENAVGHHLTIVEAERTSAFLSDFQLNPVIQQFMTSFPSIHSIELCPKRWGKVNPFLVRRMAAIPDSFRVVQIASSQSSGGSSPCMIRRRENDPVKVELWHKWKIPQMMCSDFLLLFLSGSLWPRKAPNRIGQKNFLIQTYTFSHYN